MFLRCFLAGGVTFLKEERRGWHLWGRGSTAVLKVCQVKALLGYPGPLYSSPIIGCL